MKPDLLTEMVRQKLAEFGASNIELKPFMPLEHYQQHFAFHPYTDWPKPDFVRTTWDIHYYLFELYKYHYGFFLPTAEVMDRLVTILRDEIGPIGRVLEAASGSGFLSKELCNRGIDVFAVDSCDYENKERVFGYPMINVYQRNALGDAIEYLSEKFSAVIMIWPPYDRPFAFDIAKAMYPGQLLVFEGEFAGGCVADDKFFEYMADESCWTLLKDLSTKLDEVHVTFLTQHDHWLIWRKIAK